MSCELCDVHYAKYMSFHWLITHHFQVIIFGCWIFAIILNLPLFLVTIFDESAGDCKWNWPERWMGAAYDTTWLVLLAIIPLIIMTGLYSRVVYTLWFKRNDDNELAFQQKVISRKEKSHHTKIKIYFIGLCKCHGSEVGLHVLCQALQSFFAH